MPDLNSDRARIATVHPSLVPPVEQVQLQLNEHQVYSLFMKVVIPAGGTGSRLSPLTEFLPKALLPVVGVAPLHRILDHVNIVPELSEVIVLTNDLLYQHFVSWHESNPAYQKVRVETSQQVGIVRSLLSYLEIQQDPDDILMILSDILFDWKLSGIVQAFLERREPVLSVVRPDQSHIPTAKYGIVVIGDNDRIVSYTEKSLPSPLHYIDAGCYAFPRDIHQFLRRYEATMAVGNSSGDSIGYFLEWLSSVKGMYAHRCEGEWFDIGTQEDLRKAIAAYSDRTRYLHSTLEPDPLQSNLEIRRGVRGIRFIKRAYKPGFNPEDVNVQSSQIIEERQDPLTHTWARVNPSRATRPAYARIPGKERELLNLLADVTSGDCPWCARDIYTPQTRFPSYLVSKGECEDERFVLIPSSHSLGEFHSIGIFKNGHSRQLSMLREEDWKSCMSLSRRLFEAISRSHSGIRYFDININYMPLAGASVFHPHVQLVASSRPSNRVTSIIDGLQSYQSRWHSLFHRDLIESEIQLKERYIGRTGGIHWVAAFAPSENAHCVGISTDVTDYSRTFLNLDIDGLASGLWALTQSYEDCDVGMGINSYNLAVSLGERLTQLGMPLICQAVGRVPRVEIIKANSDPFVGSQMVYFVNDQGVMEVLHDEAVVEIAPEVLARKIAPFFKKAV